MLAALPNSCNSSLLTPFFHPRLLWPPLLTSLARYLCCHHFFLSSFLALVLVPCLSRLDAFRVRLQRGRRRLFLLPQGRERGGLDWGTVLRGGHRTHLETSILELFAPPPHCVTSPSLPLLLLRSLLLLRTAFDGYRIFVLGEKNDDA